VFADYCTGEVFGLEIAGDGTGIAASGEWVELAEAGEDEKVTAVVSGPDGSVYVLIHSDPVYRLDAVA
jgi:hypothetical protein